MTSKNTLCGVIGNPIEHSLSPPIHKKFATQLNINCDYQKYLVETEQLETFVKDFFNQGGTGLNVTLPFKQQVLNVVAELSEASQVCQAVNTLSVDQSGKIKGDTTDGEGLLLDLKRLNFDTHNKNILVVGAGGASISVIYALLKNNAKVTLHNRSKDKISSAISQFTKLGKIKAFELSNNNANINKFDGIICATSQFNLSLIEPTISQLAANAFIYDLNYAQRAEECLKYFKNKGFSRLSDGYGMLVGQAAKSFEIWHGVLPKLELD